MAAGRRGRRRAASLLAWVLLGGVLAAPAAGQEVRMLGGAESAGGAWSPASRKLARPLRALAEDFRLEGFSREGGAEREGARGFWSPLQRVDAGGRVQVEVRVADATLGALDELHRAGLEVEASSGELGLVQGWVAVDGLEALASLGNVLAVRRPSYATRRQHPPAADLGSATSQGDAIHRCDEARGLGLTGAGITVGVISDGVSGLAQSKASGNIPPSAQDVTPGGGQDGDEGTAMMEIIADCAPGARLLFSGFINDDLTAFQFTQAVGTLVSGGAHVVVDDLGFYSEPFFEDGVIASNDRIRGNQVLRVSAAGNDQGVHHEAAFSPGGPDPDGNGVRHRFAGGDELLRMAFQGTAVLVLQWSERFGQAVSDYRLCLRSSGGALIGCSSDAQEPGEGDDPLDALAPSCGAVTCQVDLQISRVAGTGTPTVKVYCLGACSFLEHATDTNLIFAQPGVPEVLGVAAAPASAPTVIESYSSHGPASILFPAPDVRPKPDLTGVDCVATSRPGFNPFCGTSAAAPHVAGIAALVLEQDGSLSPATLRQRLTSTAVDLSPAGFDDAAGFGRADAVFAVENTPPGPPPPPPPAPGPGLALGVETNGTVFHSGDTIVVTATVQPGASSTVVDGYLVVRLPDGTFLSVLLGGQIVPGVVPIVRSFVPAPFTGELVRFTFAGSEIPGTYTLLSAFALPGTLTFVSPVDADPFSFVP